MEERITNSLPCQAISSLEVDSTRVICPVAGSTFAESAVRVLEWTKPGIAGPKGVGRDVFMEMNCPFFCPDQRDMTAQIICGGLIR